MRYQWFGPGDGLWMIGGLLFLIALIVLVVWVVNTLMRADRAPRGSAGDPSRPAPTDILRERFARGEITEEQFEQAKKVLARDG
jgi:putative membrane protein